MDERPQNSIWHFPTRKGWSGRSDPFSNPMCSLSPIQHVNQDTNDRQIIDKRFGEQDCDHGGHARGILRFRSGQKVHSRIKSIEAFIPYPEITNSSRSADESNGILEVQTKPRDSTPFSISE
ncbi:hypothetical protein NPIL_146021 [Nephila pilipes]|uniref:Uncharacterized protein n=1 Tax=Nephila pilipes TaxID=299642 RepID=A0A8X6Q5T1_NEPPI|nr:hypothetical protein NPIL_146021 [Nephila pilipes]